jgi:hypothetical protein
MPSPEEICQNMCVWIEEDLIIRIFMLHAKTGLYLLNAHPRTTCLYLFLLMGFQVFNAKVFRGIFSFATRCCNFLLVASGAVGTEYLSYLSHA